MSAYGDALNALLDAQVTDLGDISSNIRADGLPQDWVDDAPNVAQADRDELRAIIEDRRGQYSPEPQWLGSLYDLLASP